MLAEDEAGLEDLFRAVSTEGSAIVFAVTNNKLDPAHRELSMKNVKNVF